MSIQENVFENVVCEMGAILFRSQCDKKMRQLLSYSQTLTASALKLANG